MNGKQEKTDCFGYKAPKRCSALTDMVCYGGKECPFYKTREQFEQDVEDARKKNEKKGGVKC